MDYWTSKIVIYKNYFMPPKIYWTQKYQRCQKPSDKKKSLKCLAMLAQIVISNLRKTFMKSFFVLERFVLMQIINSCIIYFVFFEKNKFFMSNEWMP